MSSGQSYNRPILERPVSGSFNVHRPTPPPISVNFQQSPLVSSKTTNDLSESAEEKPFENGAPPILKRALTSADNYISLDQMYPGRSNSGIQSSSDSLPSMESIGSEEEQSELQSQSQSRLYSESPLQSPRGEDSVSIPRELPISEAMQRRQKEWADRGAAVIVKDVKDENTGQVTKQVIKKGINDFKFGETLGDGSYSTVLLATSIESGKKYAVKVLNKEYLIKQKKVKYVNIEKNTLQRLKNTRGIISLFFTFQDETSLYFLLEYAPNGDLLSLMRKFGSINEKSAQYYSAQIIDALDFMHKKGVIHRDLKPENILLDKDMKVKLTDFGTARLLEGSSTPEGPKYDLLTRSNSFVGTAEYVSPELLNDNYVDFRCDIWAFGCILFQMIAGKPPFKANNEYLTFQKVMKVQFAFTAGFPMVIRDLVKNILIKNPDRRLVIDQIKAHLFYSDINFNDGSVWTNDPPELGPYKVSARALQKQVPKVPSSPASPFPQDPSGNSGISSAKYLHKSPRTHSSTSQRSSPDSLSGPKKREIDQRTQKILNNVKMKITQRNEKRAAIQQQQQQQQQQSTNVQTKGQGDNSLNPATAAAAALHIINKPSNGAIRRQSASSSSAGSLRTQRKTNVPSRTSSAHSSTHSKSAPTTPPSQARKESLSLPPMSKLDILWSYYLKNINERVIKMGELYMATAKSQNLENRINKARLHFLDADGRLQKKNTLLSQVVRGGGNVTGFRQETSNLVEDDFYHEFLIDEDSLERSFKKKVEQDESSAEGISKLKHFFSKPSENSAEFLSQTEFVKRTCVITTFGRFLLFAKRNTINHATELYYDIEYDIDLAQLGVKIKEIIPEKKLNSKDTFVIQTPFKSFVLQSEESETLVWLSSLLSAVKIKNERHVHKEASINAIANKAALLAEHEHESNTKAIDSLTISPNIRRTSSFTTQRQKNSHNGHHPSRPISGSSRMLSRSEQIFRPSK